MPTVANSGTALRPVKSADRTLLVLERLSEWGEPASLPRLARELDIPKSSLHAILRTMLARGWLEMDAQDRFTLGVRALLVGTSYVDTADIVALTAGTLDWLAETLAETIHLGRLDGADIVYLAKRESPHPLRLFSAIGRRLPAYSTALGKAILAELPGPEVAEHVPENLQALTPRTITDRATLSAELRSTHERGYARDDQENMEGLICLAVALPIAAPAQDAISCSIPSARLDATREVFVLEQLRGARDRIVSRAHRAVS